MANRTIAGTEAAAAQGRGEKSAPVLTNQQRSALDAAAITTDRSH
jgi:hypothetical protein